MAIINASNAAPHAIKDNNGVYDSIIVGANMSMIDSFLFIMNFVFTFR